MTSYSRKLPANSAGNATLLSQAGAPPAAHRRPSLARASPARANSARSGPLSPQRR